MAIVAVAFHHGPSISINYTRSDRSNYARLFFRVKNQEILCRASDLARHFRIDFHTRVRDTSFHASRVRTSKRGEIVCIFTHVASRDTDLVGGVAIS